MNCELEITNCKFQITIKKNIVKYFKKGNLRFHNRGKSYKWIQSLNKLDFFRRHLKINYYYEKVYFRVFYK